MTLKHEGQGGGFLYHKCNELIVFYIPLFESHVNDVNTIYGKVMLGNARDHCWPWFLIVWYCIYYGGVFLYCMLCVGIQIGGV